MTYPLYSRVRVVTDRFQSEGAGPGTIGYVIETYDDGAYEIEVSDPGTGVTTAQFVAGDDDLEPADG